MKQPSRGMGGLRCLVVEGDRPSCWPWMIGVDRFKALTKYGVGGDGFDPGVDLTKFSCQ